MILSDDRIAARYISKIAKEHKEPAIYVGVFLAKMDRQRLLKAIPPVHPQIFADHLTLKFRDDPTDSIDISEFPIGKTVSLKVVGMAENDKAQAVVVQGIKPEDGRIPHITISTATGVNPQYSNELVGSGHITPIKNGLVLRGTISWWDGLRSRTDGFRG